MRRLSVAVLSIVMVMLIAFPALAQKPLTPEKLDGAELVSTDWVKAHYGEVKIFDVRKKAEFVDGHIKGAISVPYKEKSAKSADFDSTMDKLDITKFPADKNEVIVIHCNGPRCWKSYKAAAVLVRAGYKNVKWYRKGFPDWKANGNPVE